MAQQSQATPTTVSSKRAVVMVPGLGESGGLAKRSTLLLHGLATRGWEIRGVARAGTATRPRVVRDGVLVVEIPGFRLAKAGAVPYLLVAVPLGVWWARTADVVFAIQASSPATAAALSAAVWKRPLLVSISTSGALSETSMFVNGFLGRSRRWLLRRATFLGQTARAAAELAAAFPGASVAVLPNPVEAMAEPPPLLGHPHAMYAGRFAAEKDLLVLLEAWRSVAEKVPEARLALVGAGGSYRSTEKEVRTQVAADERLEATVELPGWVADMSSWWSSHDVFVLPSLSEGMSNVLLEACAAGRVVVASAIPPNVAVLGQDYPLLYDPGNVRELTDAILVALTDAIVRREAREHVLARAVEHSVDRVIDRLEELISGAADRPRHQL